MNLEQLLDTKVIELRDNIKTMKEKGFTPKFIVIDKLMIDGIEVQIKKNATPHVIYSIEQKIDEKGQ